MELDTGDLEAGTSCRQLLAGAGTMDMVPAGGPHHFLGDLDWDYYKVLRGFFALQVSWGVAAGVSAGGEGAGAASWVHIAGVTHCSPLLPGQR